jgi:hypothetical protein
MEQVKMATAKATAIEKPLIQIDDLVREMTDEEHEVYLAQIADAPTLPEATSE